MSDVELIKKKIHAAHCHMKRLAEENALLNHTRISEILLEVTKLKFMLEELDDGEDSQGIEARGQVSQSVMH